MTKQNAFIGAVVLSLVCSLNASTARACKTCVLGRGNDIFVGGLVQTGVGANPFHEGISADATGPEVAQGANGSSTQNFGLPQATTKFYNVAPPSVDRSGGSVSAVIASLNTQQFSNSTSDWRGSIGFNTATAGNWTSGLAKAQASGDYIVGTSIGATAPASVPEPASLMLMGLGVVALIRRR